MDSFLLALLLVFAVSLGARDQWLVARWSETLGRSQPLLLLGLAAAALSAGAMALLGSEFAALLPPRAARMLVAFALAAAAAELAFPVKPPTPREPTRSLGAIAIVLLARQLGDAARFAVFALAAGAVLPAASALGGAIGGGAALALGWSVGASTLERWPLVWLRRALAAALGVAALFTGLAARFDAL